ncbi:MAG: hypothetical protein IMW86_00905 [Hydrogenibacillus sp.]|nr:hypothetical protein [Hydrogenibacillus sp.]
MANDLASIALVLYMIAMLGALVGLFILFRTRAACDVRGTCDVPPKPTPHTPNDGPGASGSRREGA